MGWVTCTNQFEKENVLLTFIHDLMGWIIERVRYGVRVCDGGRKEGESDLWWDEWKRDTWRKNVGRRCSGRKCRPRKDKCGEVGACVAFASGITILYDTRYMLDGDVVLIPYISVLLLLY